MQKGPAYCGTNQPQAVGLACRRYLSKPQKPASQQSPPTVSAFVPASRFLLGAPQSPAFLGVGGGEWREGGHCCSSQCSLLTKWGWDCDVAALRMPWRARYTWVRFSLLSVPATVRLPSSWSVFRL